MNLLNFNQQLSSADHLHHQSILVRQQLLEIPGMKPFLGFAYHAAELCAEQQALALSQVSQNPSDPPLFMDESHTTSSSSVSMLTLAATHSKENTIFTFTLGVLPASISVDPATQLWKLFQQGAPLCLLFNAIKPQHAIPVVGSDDLRVCKKAIYDFLIAAKTHLHLPEDEMFTISSIFSDSSEELLKSISVVQKIIAMIDEGAPLSASLTSRLLQLLIDDASSTASKVFKEIIDTERKYIKDLELIAAYKRELQDAEILSSEQIHALFPNLNEIIEFQRRFLNGLECNINVPLRYQRIGSVFIHASVGPFKVYEPWTLGQAAAVDLISREAASMRRSSQLLDPGFELQLYIIKPVQRICKYPLLLKELIKASSDLADRQLNGQPFSSFQELESARQAMLEMANRVNEAQRRAENLEYAQGLQTRVSNWRGFNLLDLGDLLFHAHVGVRDGEVERKYLACLFEKIVFFFLESGDSRRDFYSMSGLTSPLGLSSKKKRDLLSSRKKPDRLVSLGLSSSSLSINNFHSTSSSTILFHETPSAASTLELKGRVYISEIYNVSKSDDAGHTLVIAWTGKRENGSFTLKFRLEETRNQWLTGIRECKMNELKDDIELKLGASISSRLASPVGSGESSPLYSSFEPLVLSQPRSGSFPATSRGSLSLSGGTSGFDPVLARSSNGSSYRHYSSLSFNTARQQGRVKLGGVFDLHSLRHSGPFAAAGEESLPVPAASLYMIVVYQTTKILKPLVLDHHVAFTDLFHKIVQHISTSDATEDDILVNKIKYKDEDGDFVVLDSDDDWGLALDMLAETHDRETDTESLKSGDINAGAWNLTVYVS